MKKTQDIKLRIDQKHTNIRKKRSHMPIVKCTCGARILLVPDVAGMSLAVKNHMAEHKDADEQLLIGQIFDAASKQASA
jgi:hypothetical protein